MENIKHLYEIPAHQATRLLTKRSFASLSTTSSEGRSHGAGVLYAYLDGTFYIHTMRSSRKARNIATNGRAALCVPIRRLPVGPPSSIQFQGAAELLDLDDPEILSLVNAGRLKSLTSHGELEEADGCFVRITPGERILTYGLGMSLRRLIADPIHAAGIVQGSVAA